MYPKCHECHDFIVLLIKGHSPIRFYHNISCPFLEKSNHKDDIRYILFAIGVMSSWLSYRNIYGTLNGGAKINSVMKEMQENSRKTGHATS